MSLPEDYLKYPHRSHGMDHELYPWTNMFERHAVHWPEGKGVALWITIASEFFPLSPNDGPFRAPGHMVTPYPDYRTFTTKDYGNRVGIYRILKLLDRYGIKASVPMCSEVAARYPYLLEAVLEGGHELIGHGRDMNSIHYGGMDDAIEREQIEESLTTLRDRSGQPVTGWASPGRSESANTLHLLPEYGIQYACDWVNDDMPYKMTVRSGVLYAMPHTSELEDRTCMTSLGHSEATYVEEVMDAFDLFRTESKKYGGRILHLGLTPYVIGQPFRIWALEQLLERFTESGDIWSATGAEILDSWKVQQD